MSAKVEFKELKRTGDQEGGQGLQVMIVKEVLGARRAEQGTKASASQPWYSV